MPNCLFCKIASGEIPSETFYEDKDVRVFKDINPKAPVHLLVVPKVHIQSIAHLETNHSDVITKIIYIAKRTAADRGLTGYKLVFNVGKEGGQVIDHLHLHLLGGWGSKEEKKVDV
ncbi:MAG: histidine triad nucleotide-binding protein [Candidatus Sungbacteria bacterium]|nr:histidine triad nucleotide-binding protein [Candidatus Sungbacteria bacterium]